MCPFASQEGEAECSGLQVGTFGKNQKLEVAPYPPVFLNSFQGMMDSTSLFIPIDELMDDSPNPPLGNG